jgi:hypothetical protein
VNSAADLLIVAMSWVTVSWVATASSRVLELSARRCFPTSTPVASTTARIASKMCWRAFGLTELGPPVGEVREVEAQIIEREPAGDLPVDARSQCPDRVAVRQTFKSL